LPNIAKARAAAAVRTIGYANGRRQSFAATQNPILTERMRRVEGFANIRITRAAECTPAYKFIGFVIEKLAHQ